MHLNRPIARSSFLMLAAAMLLTAAGPLTLAGSALAAERATVRVGSPPPSLSLPDLSGRTHSLPQEGAGSPMVIHFWNTACHFCLDEMPAMDALYRSNSRKGLKIFAVNVGDSREQAKEFIEQTGVSYPVLLDKNRAVWVRFGLTGLPATFFIDRSGTIKHKLLGAASRETLTRYIQNLF
ncbi:MAG: redoxin domain-containing protein [Geobacter sp.]|nr:redoxin domain-containing protein [Geobacter sp.]